MTARTLLERARCSSFPVASGSRFNVAGSTSAITGVAPQRVIELTEAKKLKADVITLLSGPTPEVCNASHKASVPDAQPTEAGTPRYSADSRSKPSTSGPPMKYCVVKTRSTAAATSSLMLSYCRLRSSMGIGSCLGADAGEEGSDCAVSEGIANY